jgi:Domain of Unknown Function with PDB structure (DUF3857)
VRPIACSSSLRNRSCLPRNLSPAAAFTAPSLQPTLAVVKCFAVVLLLILAAQPTCAQQKPPEVPAQFELLETRVRFEANGDSRKEVRARVKINNELGARQFARLNFDYNRSFEQVEIPLVRITHPSGGTSDILPSAIADNANPAVVNAPAYQDVRVKSVRILGLAPGDTLEYRVVTTVSHHPLAPDFWLDHTFDRTGVVSKEIFDFELSTASKIQLRINPAIPPTSLSGDIVGGVCASRCIYHWEHANPIPGTVPDKEPLASGPDITLTTFQNWELLAEALGLAMRPSMTSSDVVKNKAIEFTSAGGNPMDRLEGIYDFVSQKVKTIDLPIGATGFRARQTDEIFSSGYATPEDKFRLFTALVTASGMPAHFASFFTGAPDEAESQLPRPTLFTHLLTAALEDRNTCLDLNLEVAPFLMVPSEFRGRAALLADPLLAYEDRSGPITVWFKAPKNLPFPASQKVNIDATLSSTGTLASKVRYILRGDSELLLRVAFHRTAREKWKEVAQLLALSDGFRGQIASVNASDPYATKEPFTVEYEISQPKFVDWSKKPVRIPAILPLVGLPDLPAKAAPGAAPPPIDLGTPLDVEAHVTLHLPVGATATAPVGTSVARDYARFSSSYSAQAATITASRHLHFLLREIPAARAADYNAFLRAVQNDEAQEFTLERRETTSPKTNSATPNKPAPPSPNAQKP